MTNKEKTAYQMHRYRTDPEYRARILENKKRHRRNAEAKVKARALLKSPRHRVLSNLRKRTDEKLETIGEPKFSGALSAVLGCGLQAFRNHIESMFRDGMTWENYGVIWELDHVIPLAAAMNRASVLELSHYTNIQPLLVHENWIKGARMPGCTPGCVGSSGRGGMRVNKQAPVLASE